MEKNCTYKLSDPCLMGILEIWNLFGSLRGHELFTARCGVLPVFGHMILQISALGEISFVLGKEYMSVKYTLNALLEK